MISLNVGLLFIIFAAWQLDIVDLDHEIEIEVRSAFPDPKIDNNSFWDRNFSCSKYGYCDWRYAKI